MDIKIMTMTSIYDKLHLILLPWIKSLYFKTDITVNKDEELFKYSVNVSWKQTTYGLTILVHCVLCGVLCEWQSWEGHVGVLTAVVLIAVVGVLALLCVLICNEKRSTIINDKSKAIFT